jgi:hypothetical protein
MVVVVCKQALAQLKESGILTEEEFQREKARI